jgi:hypothetical protein
MTELILSDGKVENTWFKTFFEEKNYKRIGIKCSSGTDSSLVLFFLAKFITETESFDKVIYPWTGIELNNTHSKAELLVTKIINLIRSLYPKVNIQDIHYDYWLRSPEHADPKYKHEYFIPAVNKFQIEKRLDIFITGATLNPPKSIMRIYDIDSKRPIHRDSETITDNYMEDNIPWINNNKKFISYMYKKYGLMENLFPLTESCISETEKSSQIFPCKKCFWCLEKYWAFGMFDKCETK